MYTNNGSIRYDKEIYLYKDIITKHTGYHIEIYSTKILDVMIKVLKIL